MTTDYAKSAARRLAEIFALVLSTLVFATPSFAGEAGWPNAQPEFLPVDEAFVLSANLDADGALLAQWQIADGYYLYRHRFGFKTDDAAGERLGETEIPAGKQKVDEYFGAVEVYYQDAWMRAPIETEGGAMEIGISYQGCAEAGLCYPPQTRWVSVQPGTGTVVPKAPEKR